MLGTQNQTSGFFFFLGGIGIVMLCVFVSDGLRARGDARTVTVRPKGVCLCVDTVVGASVGVLLVWYGYAERRVKDGGVSVLGTVMLCYAVLCCAVLSEQSPRYE